MSFHSSTVVFWLGRVMLQGEVRSDNCWQNIGWPGQTSSNNTEIWTREKYCNLKNSYNLLFPGLLLKRSHEYWEMVRCERQYNSLQMDGHWSQAVQGLIVASPENNRKGITQLLLEKSKPLGFLHHLMHRFPLPSISPCSLCAAIRHVLEPCLMEKWFVS